MKLEQLTEAASWMLVHFLWQGAAVALVLLIVLKLCRSASIHYWSSASAMLALASIAVVTFIMHLPETPEASASTEVNVSAIKAGVEPDRQPLMPVLPIEISESAGSDVPAAVAEVPGGSPLPAVESTSDSVAPVIEGASAEQSLLSAENSEGASSWRQWVVALWLCGIGCFAFRFFRDLGAVKSLRRSASDLTDHPEWKARFQSLCQRAGVAFPVKLMKSAAIKVPVAMGVIKPLIIVPTSMISGISPAQVDAILLHELAHVRRSDFLVNLIQSLIEAVFFFHPAVWWISTQMRVERENCCDDIATDACGDVAQYASALAALEESAHAQGLSPAADGGSPGGLLGRIRRLLGDDAPSRQRMGFAAALLGGLAAVALVFSITLAVSGLAVAAEGGDEIDMATLQTTQFGHPNQDIFCIHDDDTIYAVVSVTPPKDAKSHSMSAGVCRFNEDARHGHAWAEYQWDDDLDLSIELSSEDPGVLRLNDQKVILERGKVVFWRSSLKSADQSKVISRDLPEPEVGDDKLAEKIASVRSRIIKELSPGEDQEIIAPKSAGRWDLGEGVSFELDQYFYQDTEVQTTGIIRWPKSDRFPALRHEFQIAHSVIGSSSPYAVAMEKDARRLYFTNAGMFHTVDFSNPEQVLAKVTNHGFGDLPPAVRAELQKRFRLTMKLDDSGEPVGGGVFEDEIVHAATTDGEFIVRGKVLAGSGEESTPMSNARVAAYADHDPTFPIGSTRSDGKGDFQLVFRMPVDALAAFSGVRIKTDLPGFYEFNLHNSGDYAVYFDEDDVAIWRAPLVVGKPGISDFQMFKATRLTGVVKDEAGKPIPNAYVAVRVDENAGREIPKPPVMALAGHVADSTRTDENGRFLLDRVPSNRKLRLLVGRDPERYASAPAMQFTKDSDRVLTLSRGAGGGLKVAVGRGSVDPNDTTLVRVIDRYRESLKQTDLTGQREVAGPERPVVFARLMLNWAKSCGSVHEGMVNAAYWNSLLAWGRYVHVTYRDDIPPGERKIEVLPTDSPVSEIVVHHNDGGITTIFVRTEDDKFYGITGWALEPFAAVLEEPALKLNPGRNLPFSYPGAEGPFYMSFPGGVGFREPDKKPKPTSMPEFKRFWNDKRSAMGFHRDGKPLLLLYSKDFIQTGLEYSESGEGPSAVWRIKGVINLLRDKKEVRQFQFRWASGDPDTVLLDGVPYRLKDSDPPEAKGLLKVEPSRTLGSIILSADGPPLGVSRWLKLEEKEDLDEIGRHLDSDAFGAKHYKESRALLRERGALIEWDAQHPISHSDGEYVAKLRIFPDGRIAAIYDRRRIEGSISKEQLGDLLEYLDKGSPRAPAVEPAKDGKPAMPGISGWSSYQDFVRYKLGEEVKTIHCANGRDEPIDGKWFDPIRERLNRVVSLACAGGDDALKKYAALAQIELLKRHPDTPIRITPEAMRYAGVDSDGNRSISFYLYTEAPGVGFPRGTMSIRFMADGTTKLEKASYIKKAGGDVDEWKTEKGKKPLAGEAEEAAEPAVILAEDPGAEDGVELVFAAQSVFYPVDDKEFSFEIVGTLPAEGNEEGKEWSAPMKCDEGIMMVSGILTYMARWRCMVPDGLQGATLKMKGPKNAVFQISDQETRDPIGKTGTKAEFGDIFGEQPDYGLAVFCAAPAEVTVLNEDGEKLKGAHVSGMSIEKEIRNIPFTLVGEEPGKFTCSPSSYKISAVVTKEGYLPARAEFDCGKPNAKHAQTVILRKRPAKGEESVGKGEVIKRGRVFDDKKDSPLAWGKSYPVRLAVRLDQPDEKLNVGDVLERTYVIHNASDRKIRFESRPTIGHAITTFKRIEPGSEVGRKDGEVFETDGGVFQAVPSIPRSKETVHHVLAPGEVAEIPISPMKLGDGAFPEGKVGRKVYAQRGDYLLMSCRLQPSYLTENTIPQTADWRGSITSGNMYLRIEE